ncbi:hypothetical protein D3C85_1325550 [compost metagenome]
MVLQCPLLRDMPYSASKKPSRESVPARYSACIRKISVPEPTRWLPTFPLIIAPPWTRIVGRSTLAAPIRYAGAVLSQPVSKTTPSSGFARSVVSSSMLIMLRNIMPVGRMMESPMDMVGNTRGYPPASRIPRETHSASSVRCALQGTRSDAELAIPMTGRPSNISGSAPRALR